MGQKSNMLSIISVGVTEFFWFCIVRGVLRERERERERERVVVVVEKKRYIERGRDRG